MKNRYVSKAKISEAKFRQVVKCFALDLSATQTADMCALNRNTSNRLFCNVRTGQTLPVSGEIEVDESGFGAKHVRGRRGRGHRRENSCLRAFQAGRKAYRRVARL